MSRLKLFGISDGISFELFRYKYFYIYSLLFNFFINSSFSPATPTLLYYIIGVYFFIEKNLFFLIISIMRKTNLRLTHFMIETKLFGSIIPRKT